MSKLPTAAERMIEDARRAHGPSPAELARTLDALHGRLAFHDSARPQIAAAAAVAADVALASSKETAAALGGATGTLAGTAGVLTGKAALKLILATVVIGGSVGTAVLVQPTAPAKVATVTVSAPRAPAASAPPQAAAVEPDITPEPDVAPLAVSEPLQPAVRTSGRRPDEMTLIGRALSRLRDRDATGALALLGEHAEHYPHGKFATERKGLRVLALCASGRRDEARRARAAFLAQHPRAPIVASVRGACREGR